MWLNKLFVMISAQEVDLIEMQAQAYDGYKFMIGDSKSF